ncbi:MAG: hypothetical protein RIQ93_145, partial [Verrucomicrobiota bacterium]
SSVSRPAGRSTSIANRPSALRHATSTSPRSVGTTPFASVSPPVAGAMRQAEKPAPPPGAHAHHVFRQHPGRTNAAGRNRTRDLHAPPTGLILPVVRAPVFPDHRHIRSINHRAITLASESIRRSAGSRNLHLGQVDSRGGSFAAGHPNKAFMFRDSRVAGTRHRGEAHHRPLLRID